MNPRGNQLIIVRTYTSAELFDQNPMPLFVNESRESLGDVRTKQKQPCHTPQCNEKLRFYVKPFADNLFQKIGLTNLLTTSPNNFPIFYPFASVRRHNFEVAAYGIIDQRILDDAGFNDRVGWAIFLDLDAIIKTK